MGAHGEVRVGGRMSASRGVQGPTGVSIRPMRRADLAEVLRIENACFSVAWSERTFRGLLARSNASLVVAQEETRPGGPILGYAVLWVAGGEAELGDLAVDPRARRRGVGSALLAATLEEAARRGAQAVLLEVRESNRAARSLYEGEGFRVVGLRSRYYLRPVEDALVMRREVGAPVR